MAENEDKQTEKQTPTKKEIVPIKQMRTAKADVRSYSVLVPTGMGKKELEKADLWDHVANSLQQYDEVRCLAEDGSFVANVIVTFKAGNKVLVKTTNFTELEVISYAEHSGMNRFEVKQRGPKKWCILDTKDGSVVHELIPTQSEAYKKLEEHIAIINR